MIVGIKIHKLKIEKRKKERKIRSQIENENSRYQLNKEREKSMRWKTNFDRSVLYWTYE